MQHAHGRKKKERANGASHSEHVQCQQQRKNLASMSHPAEGCNKMELIVAHHGIMHASIQRRPSIVYAEGWHRSGRPRQMTMEWHGAHCTGTLSKTNTIQPINELNILYRGSFFHSSSLLRLEIFCTLNRNVYDMCSKFKKWLELIFTPNLKKYENSGVVNTRVVNLLIFTP